MLSNNNCELRTFIFKLLGIYSECLVSICKIWEMSCHLFLRLLEPLLNIENVSVPPTEQSNAPDGATELNTSQIKRNVCESQLPAVKQNAFAEAKVETPSEHAKAAKSVEASAETLKQVSTEAKCVTAEKADGTNKTKSNISKLKLKTPKLKSFPPVEETKPAEVIRETTSSPPVETHKPTESVSTSSVVEVVSSTPSIANKQITSSPPSKEGRGKSKSSTRERVNKSSASVSFSSSDELPSFVSLQH
ncbi:MAG: hypothetical protein ACTS6G_04875 [Candidatus Hodgkinia cicadicola]